MGIRMIAGIMISSFDLPNIRTLFQTSFDMEQAFLMPKFKNFRKIGNIMELPRVSRNFGDSNYRSSIK
jgi:hypothetical protein